MVVLNSKVSLISLVVARRLLVLSERFAQRLTQRREGKDVDAQTDAQTKAQDALAEDELLLSGKAGTQRAERSRDDVEVYGTRRASRSEGINIRVNIRIKLSQLIHKLRALRENPRQAQAHSTRQATVVIVEHVETKVTVRYEELPYVHGLIVRDKRRAETDRYAFDFINGATFRITDKWSGKSTTIWGDPHVDTSDEAGRSNGEFKDLDGSNTHTTFMLEESTRVTFTARDEGIIEVVDIFKGSQHVRGIGRASKEWSAENGLFAPEVKDDAQGNGQDIANRVPLGDVVYVGGDGNDWYDASGRLIWGKKTGPKPIGPPAATWQMTVRHSRTRSVFAQTVDRWG